MRVFQPWIEFFLFVFLFSKIHSQLTRTLLDDKLQPVVRSFRKITTNVVGRTGVNPQLRKANQRTGKQQRNYPKSTPFFCNTTGGRSRVRPTSVHRLRPGDIDVIAGIGDSLTAGNGIMGTNVLDINTENRGISWSIGGQENWRTFLTLPNILKEFNPKLYGYGVTDSFSVDKSSNLNTAEPGAMSRDIPHQVRNLIKRMKNNPKINMANDWKIATIFIGGNDFCSDICYYDDPQNVVLKNHEKDMIEALRTLRDNVPRLIVNVVPAPNVRVLTELRGKPKICYYTNLFECPCFFGWRANYINFFSKIIEEWQQLDKKIAQRDEFNTETFTVNFQPFSMNINFPKISENLTDFTYIAPDCFHLSQKGQATAANAIWNNILEPEGRKTNTWRPVFSRFLCPTAKTPYIATRVNSRWR